MKESLRKKKNRFTESISSIITGKTNQQINKEKLGKHSKMKNITCIEAILFYFLFYIFHRFFIAYPGQFAKALLSILHIDIVGINLILEGRIALYMDFSAIKLLIALLLPYLIMILIIIATFKIIKGDSLDVMGLKNPFNDKISIIIAFFLASLDLLIFLLFYQAGKLTFRNVFDLDLPSAWRVISFPLINIFGSAFYEELGNRGFLQTILTQKIGKIKGIVLVAIFDTLRHTGYYGAPTTLFIVFFKSLIFGYLYSRKNNLSSPFIYHSLDNFVIWLGGK